LEITVLATPAIREAYNELVPRDVRTTWIGTAELAKRLDAGEVFDVVICTATLLEALIAKGRVLAGSRADVARSRVGVAVRAGSPPPDFGSELALKKMLVCARTIGISTGPSGVYLNELFESMGLLEEIRPRFRIPPPGGMVSELLVKGEVEVAFQQVAELVNKPGVDYLGPLPDSLQRVTVFAGGVHARSSQPDAARAFLRSLASPENRAVLRRHGLEPGAASPR